MIKKLDDPTLQNPIFLFVTTLDTLLDNSDKHIELTAHMCLVQSLSVALVLHFLLVATDFLVLFEDLYWVLFASCVHMFLYMYFGFK